MPSSDALSLTVSLSTPSIQSAALGVPLIMGSNSNYATAKSKAYTSLASILADTDGGIIATDMEYLQAEAMFAQSQRVASVRIGKAQAAVPQVDKVVVDKNTDGDYTVTLTVEGAAVVYTYAAVGKTKGEIATALVGLINAGTQPVTATDTTDDFNLTADNAGQPFTTAVSGVSAGLILTHTTPNTGAYENLSTIAAENNDWFGLVIESRNIWDIKEASRYAASNKKLFIGQSNDADLITSAVTDVGTYEKGLAHEMTKILYFSVDATPCDAAYMGKKLACDPDLETTLWAHATLIGITPDTLSDAVQTILEGKNVDYYCYDYDGVGSTRWGVQSSGHKTDAVISREWLRIRLGEDIRNHQRQVSNSNKKDPYTDAGIGVYKGITLSRLLEGEKVGHFAEDSSRATFAGSAGQPLGYKALRKIYGTFSTILGGAVERVAITGDVTE